MQPVSPSWSSRAADELPSAVAQGGVRRCHRCEMDVMRPGSTPPLEDRDRRLDAAWRTHAPVAMRFATALVGPSDAPDITTTAFLRVTGRPEWDQIEHLDRYLLRAVRSEALNLYRQRRRRWQRDLAAVEPHTTLDPTPDPDLMRAVAALSVRQRSVVFLAGRT